MHTVHVFTWGKGFSYLAFIYVFRWGLKAKTPDIESYHYLTSSIKETNSSVVIFISLSNTFASMPIFSQFLVMLLS